MGYRDSPRRFEDDGRVLYLDVHGCRVSDALALVRRAAQEACWRGRAQVVVVTGHSTSDDPSAPTIKNQVQRALSSGAWDAWVSAGTWSLDGGVCTLWTVIGRPENPRRVRVQDLLTG